MLILIPCGAKKREVQSPARELYLGDMFRMTLRAAETIAGEKGGRILILSGRHGLLELDQVVAPYEQRIDQPGAVSSEAVRRQAEDLGLLDEAEVLVLAGKAYSETAQKVWPHARTPLCGLRGIGYQRQVLSRIIRGEFSTLGA